jgi:hypothetical protein
MTGLPNKTEHPPIRGEIVRVNCSPHVPPNIAEHFRTCSQLFAQQELGEWGVSGSVKNPARRRFFLSCMSGKGHDGGASVRRDTLIIRYIQFLSRCTLYYTRHKSDILAVMKPKLASKRTPKTGEKPARKADSTGAKPAGKARLLTLEDLDRRTNAYKLTAGLIESLEDDLGGAGHVSVAERQIVQRAAVLGAMAADLEARWIGGGPVDPLAFTTIANAQRRLLEAVGLQRRARDVTPTLVDYVKARQAAPEAA